MIEKIDDLTHVTNEIARGDGRVSDRLREPFAQRYTAEHRPGWGAGV